MSGGMLREDFPGFSRARASRSLAGYLQQDEESMGVSAERDSVVVLRGRVGSPRRSVGVMLSSFLRGARSLQLVPANMWKIRIFVS